MPLLGVAPRVHPQSHTLSRDGSQGFGKMHVVKEDGALSLYRCHVNL